MLGCEFGHVGNAFPLTNLFKSMTLIHHVIDEKINVLIGNRK